MTSTEPKPKRPGGRKPRQHHASALRSIRMWPTWFVVGLAWCITRLPLPAMLAIGRTLGRILHRLARDRRHVTKRNLECCFPEESTERIDEMTREVFEQVGMGSVELMIPWLNPGRDLSACFEVRGVEHLEQAVAQGRGVILVGAHYAVMDVISQPLSLCGPIDVMYRFNKNPVWEWLQVTGRKRYFDGVIEREDTRQVLRRLKQGRVIWYAADQDYGRKHSVFAPFFGMPAATIVATSRFARLNQSPVLILRQIRTKTPGWILEFFPIIEDFPSDDDVADATRLNALLEDIIRQEPTQYLWLHKRFKTRPEGVASIYED